MEQISALTQQNGKRVAAPEVGFDVAPCMVIYFVGHNGAVKSNTAVPYPRESN